MKKFAGYFFIITYLFCYSCKKTDLSVPGQETSPISPIILAKINPWLEKQKSNPKQTGNATGRRNGIIDLVLNNLQVNDAVVEKMDARNTWLTIPLRDAVIDKLKMDKNATLALQLNLDSLGNINAGGLVYYQPEDGIKRKTFPQDNFKNLIGGKRVELNGTYKMMTATGIWISQLGVKNNRLMSSGLVTKEGGTASRDITLDLHCWDWYLVTTYYYPDGSTSQTREYLQTTCTNDCGNGDPTAPQIPCDDGGGGGNGGSDYELLDDEEFNTGGSDTDPLEGNHISTIYVCGASIYYLASTKQITNCTPRKPFAMPPLIYFVDQNGQMASATVQILDDWSCSRLYLMGGTQVLLNWLFVSKWNYLYANGPVPARTFQESSSRIFGPFQ